MNRKYNSKYNYNFQHCLNHINIKKMLKKKNETIWMDTTKLFSCVEDIICNLISIPQQNLRILLIEN